MEKQEQAPEHIQAFENSDKKEEPKKVRDIVKILEKSLNPSHFLNIKFNRNNISLYEQLMEKQKINNNNDAQQGLNNTNSSLNKK